MTISKTEVRIWVESQVAQVIGDAHAEIEDIVATLQADIAAMAWESTLEHDSLAWYGQWSDAEHQAAHAEYTFEEGSL